MKLSTIRLVYFSATFTTRKIVRRIADQFNTQIAEYDITMSQQVDACQFQTDDVLIVGMPVYAGRIPGLAADKLKQFTGNGTPAIIVCVYGNREYDDALVELYDIVSDNGFKVISAGTFIGQHSIFPKVAANRPNEDDYAQIEDFGKESAAFLQQIDEEEQRFEINIKGNRPYKIPGKIPLIPKGNKKCNICGICIKRCPVQAIPEDNPRTTIQERCIICGRCIVICPHKARRFSGLVYTVAERKFTKANILPKMPEVFFAQPLNS